MKKYTVELTDEERDRLKEMQGAGRQQARVLRRARILLLSDAGKGDREIATVLSTSVSTVERTRRHYAQEGLERALWDKPAERVYERKLDGAQEAHLVALACGPVPEGQARWSLRLLADRMVELGHVEDLSYQTVRRVLKKKRAETVAR